MKKKLLNSTGIILDFKYIPAGSADFEGNGNIKSWDEKYKLYYIPLEDPYGKVLRYTVDPSCVDEIARRLENVCWGALVHLEFSNNFVSDVEVLLDWFADYYESET